MPIEFRCQHCDKLLRVPDGSEGKDARCPDCGATVPIPSAGAPAPSRFEAASPSPTALANPYRSPGGGTIEPMAVPSGVNEFTPTLISLGDILSRSWQIFKAQALWCILAFIGVFAISFVIYLVFAVVIAMLEPRGRQEHEPPTPEMVVAFVIFGAIWFAVSTWLSLGLLNAMLRVGRGQPASIDSFLGVGSYLLPGMAATILTGLAVMAGLVFLIAPGIIIGIMLSQALLIIIDRGVGPIEALQLSMRVTAGNRLTLFGLYIVLSFIATPINACTCGLGSLATAPFTYLTFCVAYLAMTGQQTAEQIPPPDWRV